MSEDWQTPVMAIGFTALFSVGGYLSCESARDTTAPKRALNAAGYVDARVDAGSIFGELNGCAKSEIAYDATATNVRGARVSLLVCCGPFLKACTVRSR